MSCVKNETNKIFFNDNKIKIKDELVYLINTLNSVIKSYYCITKQIIFQSKENIKNQIDLICINNIENQLHIFIQNAKEIFSKMKQAKKQSLINQENKQNQLYNYCNNNFFYYSNAPFYESAQYFSGIPNDSSYKKMLYKSPKSNSCININNIKCNNNCNLSKNNIKNKSPNNLQMINKINSKNKEGYCRESEMNTNDNTNININKKINYSSNKIIIPPKKLNLQNIIVKDKILKNLLPLLKQLKAYKGKIFYETKDAQNFKKIFYLILQEINKLIEILSEEKNEEYKCLSARNYHIDKNIRNIINKKEVKKPLHLNELTEINKTFKDFNTRNLVNELKDKIKTSKSQHNNIKYRSQSMDEQSEILVSKKNENKKLKNEINIMTEKANKPNIISIRNILFKEQQTQLNQNKIEEKNNKTYIDKEQQYENIYPNIITKEKEFVIENNKINPKIIEKEQIIKELESKLQTMKNHIISLKQDLSSSNNQLQFFKIDNDKQSRQINDMTKEITLLKKLIENNDKNNEISKKNKKFTEVEELETDRDKISIKYELLKLEYDKQKQDLEEKDKLLLNYNLYTNTKESKNIDERISNLIKKHQDEIEELNNKYTKDIMNLKINLPNCFSQYTHEILIDKEYKKYNLHWYLLTIISAKNKDYENTFWVSENEIKDSLQFFNDFKNEEEIEKENMQDFFIAQKKLIQRIDNDELKIVNLEAELKKYKNKD